MKKETLDALHGSILKWQRIVTINKKDNGIKDCPLCQLFDYRHGSQPCKGCPVRGKTGFLFCGGTPYLRFLKANDLIEKKRAALAMYGFLVGLLPKQERKNAAR